MPDRHITEALATLPDYDLSLLNDWGGGNVDWWHDYLRAEIDRANAHWRSMILGILAACEPAGAEFKVGDRVRKVTGDYQLEGTVRAVFTTEAGKVRYVVEHKAEKGGFLHIYAPGNLQRVSE